MMKKMTNSGLTLIPSDRLYPIFCLKAAMRHDKSKHVIYTMFPDIRSISERVYWGVFSWSLPHSKQRWLRRNALIMVNGLEATPSDIVRDYLDYYYPHKLRATGVEARSYEEHKSAPLYVRPAYLPDAAYVDIKSTYWSIVNLIGWDIGYLSENWLIPGRAPTDFPLPTDKSARNYLVSIGLPSPVTVWTGNKFLYQNGHNPHVNRALWTATMDILHGIAARAVELGAIYVHTDGYILDARKAELLINEIGAYHLTADVRAFGPAYVFGFGNYRIGEKQTLNFDPYRQQETWNTIEPVDRKWLIKTIDHIHNRGIPQRLYRDGQF